jgi:hypothetical protein
VGGRDKVGGLLVHFQVHGAMVQLNAVAQVDHGHVKLGHEAIE